MLFEKYWHISGKPLPEALSKYAWIYCPAMDHNGHSLTTKREGHREFLRLEKHIKGDLGLDGWIAGVGLSDPHVMRWVRRMGARPFELNISEDKLWFLKKLS